MEYLLLVFILILVVASGYVLSKPLVSPPGEKAVQYYAEEPTNQTDLDSK